MKNIKFSLMLLITIFFVGCYSNVNTPQKTTEYVIKNGNDPLVIIEIDGCEYLHGDWGNATTLTHKGNCKFCLKRKN